MYRRRLFVVALAIPALLGVVILVLLSRSVVRRGAQHGTIASHRGDVSLPPASDDQSPRPRVRLETSLGTMIVELYPKAAPETVRNFLNHVTTGKYDGVMFESVTPRFARVGSFRPGFVPVTVRDSIPQSPPNESNNGLSNLRGTLTAHFSSTHYQGLAHFCFNLVDNPMLDFPNKNDPDGLGSAVFGAVVEGGEVLDALARAPRANVKLGDSNVVSDVPNPTISIITARIE